MTSDRHADLDDVPDVAADIEFLRERYRRELAAGWRPPSPTRTGPAHGRATRDLAEPASVPPGGRRYSRRRALAWVGGGAVAAAVATLGLVVVDTSRDRAAYAATPQMLTVIPPGGSGHPPGSLERLATVASRSGDPAGWTTWMRTAVDHLEIDLWDLDSVIDGRTVTSAVVASRRQLWRTARNQARVIDRYLPPQFPTAADREAWRQDGSPRGAAEDRRDYRLGAFPAVFAERPPSELDALAAWLRRSDTSDVAVLNGAVDLLAERALTGAERAALLRVLARDTGLTYAGTTVDRAGRPGAAFTMTSHSSGADVTHLVVVAPTTGTILAIEQILTAGADALRVRRPAVISYRTYRTTEFVTAIPA